MTPEQQVIEQLQSYKRLLGRIRILEKTPIGNGMLLTTICEDDKLQELHRLLRKMPSYMYLTKREQTLESVANAYLTDHPSGTRSQLHAVQQLNVMDEDDQKLLEELQGKIKKVIKARMGTVDGYEAIIERISELQDLQQQRDQIDRTLEALGIYRPHYVKLLKLRYVEGIPVDEIIKELFISEKTYRRWRLNAIEEYQKMTVK